MISERKLGPRAEAGRPPFAADQIVGYVSPLPTWHRDRVKQAGGTWNAERRVSYDRVVCPPPSSTKQHPIVDARARADSVSMQTPGRHHLKMLASTAGCWHLESDDGVAVQ
jgi:hypothetical protein